MYVKTQTPLCSLDIINWDMQCYESLSSLKTHFYAIHEHGVASVISRVCYLGSAPFKLSVFTDGNEDLADVAGEQGNNQANVNEISTAAANEPLGTQGFSIGFAQISCS